MVTRATYPYKKVLLYTGVSDTERAALLKTSSDLDGGANTSGTTIRVGDPAQDLVAVDITSGVKYIAVNRTAQPIDDTNIAALAQMTRRGRAAVEILLGCFNTHDIMSNLINAPTGMKVIWAQRADNDKITFAGYVMDIQEQGRDNSGDMTYDVTLASATPLEPQWGSP